MTDLDDLQRLAQSDWPRTSPGAGPTRQAAVRRGRRNMGATLVAGAAVLVGVIAISPTMMGNDPSGGSVPSQPAASGSADSGSSTSSPGYRPVGALGLVFEVPEAWSTNEVACDGSPTADTVGFGFGRDCVVTNPPRVSSLLITREDNHLVEAVLGQLTLGPNVIDGVQVEVSEPGFVDGMWTFAVAGRTGSVVLMRTENEDVLRHAFDSLRVIPAGHVVIPLMPRLSPQQAQEQLDQLGLETSIVDVESDAAVGSVVGTTPPVAAVVARGQRVEILRAAGR